MAEAIHFQRVTIHLKNGTNLVLDLKPEDHQTVDSQITALKMSWPIPNPKRKFSSSGEFAATVGFASKNRRF